jgi:hypothetical protein
LAGITLPTGVESPATVFLGLIESGLFVIIGCIVLCMVVDTYLRRNEMAPGEARPLHEPAARGVGTKAAQPAPPRIIDHREPVEAGVGARVER